MRRLTVVAAAFCAALLTGSGAFAQVPAEAFARTGQYRFTPPIHVIVSLGKAIEPVFASRRRE